MGQLGVLSKVTATERDEAGKCPVKYRETFATGEARLIPNAINVRMVCVEITSECAAGCVISGVRGISRRT